jgi:hypothetical protein
MDAPDVVSSDGAPASGTATATLVAPPPGPFAGGGLVIEPARPSPTESTAAPPPPLASPFAEAFTGGAEADEEAMTAAALLGELEDEAFEEALEALVDEVAARHLASTPAWSSEAAGPDVAASEAEAWAATVASQADRYLGHLEREFADRPVDSLTEEEISAAGERIAGVDPLAGATEQLFGGLVKKVVGAAKGIVKTGLKAVKGVLSIGKLFGLVRKLVPWLLRMVVNKAINRLPRGLRPAARQLAGRLAGGAARGAGAEAAEAFDNRLAGAILAPNEAAADQIVAEADDEAAQPVAEPLAALDDARARLVTQLAEAEPGQPPVAEIEQFVPAVMAILPLIRTGISLFGRDRFKRLVAKGIAGLIQGHVGPQAARALAPPITDVGMRLLNLEAEDPATLGAEALVSTVEDTIREVAALPDESLDEPLRLQAEVEQAFTEAAARHLPRHVLRPDIGAYETDDEGGVWVAMPRATRPRFRYRKWSRVYRVPIGRARARAIVLPGEDTLEDRLLDAGVAAWPVEAEVHLFEAMPGTHVGHLAAYEVDEPGATGGPAAASLATGEFEELTPEISSLLLAQPGLGRRVVIQAPGRALRPGQRLFRVVLPGARVRRRPPRLVFRLDASGARPVLRVHLRLTEREGDTIAQSLARNAHPAVVALLRRVVGAPARHNLATRLDRQARRRMGQPLPAGRAGTLAGHLAETMLTTVAKELPSAAAALAGAARDPAPGLTLTFVYTFADRAAVGTGTPEGPTLSIRPGQRRD